MRKRKQKQRRGFTMKREQKLIHVLTPCGDMVHAEFSMSMLGMTQYTNNNVPKDLAGVAIRALGTSILPKGRQDLCDAALEANATHILWIDSDMKFPADTLLRLMKYDEPIVGINAMARRPPFHCTAQHLDNTPVVTKPQSQGLEKVGRMGFAILWIDTRVFAQMRRPFFNFGYDEKTAMFTGEDYSFFEKTRELGFECYVDHTLSREVTHIGTFGYNPLLSEIMGVL